MMTKRKVHGHTRLVLSIAFIVVVSAAYALGWSSLFTVRQVVVIGAPNPSEGFVIERAVHLGDKMARLNTQALAHSLAGYTWLDHSSVSRNWFKGKVSVHVWTRTPIAQFHNQLVDNSGALFNLPSVNVSGLPLIIGTNVSSAKFAAILLSELPAPLSAQVMSVEVRGRDSAVLSIKEPTLKRTLTVAWGDQTNMSFKVSVYKALVALPENSMITTIDLSAPHAPIVK
jgi:cell division septal protein FtsQ